MITIEINRQEDEVGLLNFRFFLTFFIVFNCSLVFGQFNVLTLQEFEAIQFPDSLDNHCVFSLYPVGKNLKLEFKNHYSFNEALKIEKIISSNLFNELLFFFEDDNLSKMVHYLPKHDYYSMLHKFKYDSQDRLSYINLVYADSSYSETSITYDNDTIMEVVKTFTPNGRLYNNVALRRTFELKNEIVHQRKNKNNLWMTESNEGFDYNLNLPYVRYENVIKIGDADNWTQIGKTTTSCLRTFKLNDLADLENLFKFNEDHGLACYTQVLIIKEELRLYRKYFTRRTRRAFKKAGWL